MTEEQAPRGLSDEELETACANLRNDLATIQSVRGETVQVRVDVLAALLALRAKVVLLPELVEALRDRVHYCDCPARCQCVDCDRNLRLIQRYEEASR